MHILARRGKKKQQNIKIQIFEEKFGGMTFWSNSKGINFEAALDLWLHRLLNLNRSTRCPRVWVSAIHICFCFQFVLVMMLLNPSLSIAVRSQYDRTLSQGSWGQQQDSDLIDEVCSPTVSEQVKQRFGDRVQPTDWLVIANKACSHKADLSLSQENKSAGQDQHQ